MNFLGHAFLTREMDSDIAVGNFIGDFIKGDVDKLSLPYGIKFGAKLHRKIDIMTDSNKNFIETKRRIDKKYRHYAGIMVDIFYDHFLADMWNNYCDESLFDFSQKVYKNIEKHQNHLPGTFLSMFKYMKQGNWLYEYRKAEYAGDVLHRMSRMTGRCDIMKDGHEELAKHYIEMKKDFIKFIAEMENGGL